MTDQRIRLSTRFLPLFKGLCYASLLIVPALLLPSLLIGDWLSIQMLIVWTATAVSALLGMRKLRTVRWESGSLVVKDQADLIILPEEIKNIELKMLIGVHEVTLHEPHPYLGESFLFQVSMMYFFRHGAIDEQMHELRQHIAQARRQVSTEGVAATRRPAYPPQLGAA